MSALEESLVNFRKVTASALLVAQVLLVILYAALVEYGDGPKANGLANSDVDTYYPFYQDVHVMIFIGFGFLMTFLKKYGFSSIGYNFLISCLAIQWAMISNGLLHYIATAGTDAAHGFSKIKLGIVDLVKADFAAGAVLISFGAVLGKTTPLQLLAVVFLELIFYGINEAIGAGRLSAVDMGGSIFVHTFGAYFGLALSWVISRPQKEKSHKNGSEKKSDMFAMIGTLFLWMFWPSFNGALATEDQQYRVVINTVIALSASCVVSFVCVTFFSEDSKFDMVSIQNATLAGGVAVGSSSDLVIQPSGAMIVGLVAGLVSVVGYEKIQPFLAEKLGLDDTCGVHNLHGMPGIIGAIGGAISALSAGESAYGNSIGAVFPARAPSNATTAASLGVAPGEDRSADGQAGIQMIALLITLCFAIFGGMFTGFVIKMPWCLPGLRSEKASCCECGKSMHEDYWYEDEYFWTIEEEKTDEEHVKETLIARSQKKRSLDAQLEALKKEREAMEEGTAVSTSEKEDSSSAVEMTDQKLDDKSPEEQ